jgi:hypothetical protein
MNAIADYKGKLLNHIECLYRPGERELAVELAEALGCAITDTGFASDAGTTFLAIHPDPDDRNVQNNAFYISQMTPEQEALEESLRQHSASDGDFAVRLAAYRAKAQGSPFGVPHFGIRLPTGADVDAAVARIERDLGPRLKDRLSIRTFRREDMDGAFGDLVQAFVYQDVIVSGCFLLGQLIELQTQAPQRN